MPLLLSSEAALPVALEDALSVWGSRREMGLKLAHKISL